MNISDKQKLLKAFTEQESETYQQLCKLLDQADFYGSGPLDPQGAALFNRITDMLQNAATSMRMLRHELNQYLTTESKS